MHPQLCLLFVTILLILITHSEGLGCNRNNVLCNHRCITLNWICDGGNDCDDGSDEIGCPNRIQALWGITVSGFQQQRLKTLSWLRQQRRPIRGWGKDTNKAVVTLHLSNSGSFNMSIVTNELIVKDLQFELLDRLLRRRYNSILIYEMALYSHALLATCLNPKNFFGFNIIEKMETELKSTTPLNPFVALVLCNSNGSIPQSRIMELFNILKQASKPEWIDQQAYALMALNCLHNKSKAVLDLAVEQFKSNETYFNSYEDIKKSTEIMFLNSQYENGNFGDVYTTALVIQALLSSESYDIKLDVLSNAFNYILSQKNESDSFNDITSAYLLLPLLNGKTLLDLGRINCSSSTYKDPSIKKEFESGTQKQQIWYSIWIGEEKEYSYDMSLTISINATFYDAMLMAADVHKKYRFEYVQFPSGKYITSLSGVLNDAEARKYWYLFRLENGQPTISYIYPEQVITNSDERFVYWYRSIIYDDEKQE